MCVQCGLNEETGRNEVKRYKWRKRVKDPVFENRAFPKSVIGGLTIIHNGARGIFMLRDKS